jgi:phage regulator Rha-like protein
MTEPILITDELVLNKIYIIRDKKIMLDRDLAELYGVQTKVLNQAVKRHLKRFPEDFMFQLNEEKMNNWKSQIVTSNKIKMGLRKNPYAFTELGVSMLSSALNTELAIEVNIQLIRIFSKMREVMLSNHELILKFEQLQNKIQHHNGKIHQFDKDINVIFKYL